MAVSINHSTNHHLFRVSKCGWQVESSVPKADKYFGQERKITKSCFLHSCNETKLEKREIKFHDLLRAGDYSCRKLAYMNFFVQSHNKNCEWINIDITIPLHVHLAQIKFITDLLK